MVRVRSIHDADVETVVVLWRELMCDQIGRLQKSCPDLAHDFDEKPDAGEIFRRFLRSIIRKQNGVILLAENGQESVGYLLLILIDNIPLYSLTQFGEIIDLYVREPWRGRGVSTQMKNEAVRWCTKRGIRKLMLKALPSNQDAIHVYEKWGFHSFLTEMRMNIEKKKS